MKKKHIKRHKKLIIDLVDYFERKCKWIPIDDNDEYLEDEEDQEMYTRARKLMESYRIRDIDTNKYDDIEEEKNCDISSERDNG
jgi:hypothetical protein